MKNDLILPGIIYPVNNGYINTLKPTVTGTGAPGAIIHGQLNNLPFSVTVSAGGTWRYTIETQLTDKTDYIIQINQTNQVGTVSPQVTNRFKTDLAQLISHAVTYPNSDQKINTNSPLISGTGKPGAIIEIKQGDNVYTASVSPDGAWQIQAESLPEGPIAICIEQKEMGNTSPSIYLNFSVDTIAPAEPFVDEPCDSGFIKNARPVVKGRGEPNAAIDVVVDEKKYATKASSAGDWRCEVSETLVEDVHIISAKQTDQAGNVSPEKVSLFTVKTVQPPAPAIEDPANGTFIREASPVITGSGQQNCTIQAHIGGKVYTTKTANDGRWEMKIPQPLLEGPNTIKFYQSDEAGNVSSSVDLTLTVDTKAPLPPVVIYPEKDSYVNNPSFCIKGTGEPDAFIECTLGSTTLKTRVLSDGHWQVQIGGSDSLKYKMEYSLSVRQIDRSGNISPCTKVVFRVDQNRLSAPGLTYPANQSTINVACPVFTGTGKAGATVNLNIQNDYAAAEVAADNTWSINTGRNLAQGTYMVNISQTECGNISDVQTMTFIVDMTVPQPPVITNPKENQPLSGQVVISGSGEEGADVTVRLDEKFYTVKVINNTWNLPVMDLETGIHSILASQMVPSGSKSQCTTTNFVYDSQTQGTVNPLYPVTYQILYNPDGPAWTTETIATLKTNSPITINGTTGTTFSTIITHNGLHSFDYTDPNNCADTVFAGVTWIDHTPPVISIEPSGNYFSSDKTIIYSNNGGSNICTALLNGIPFESGKQVTEEGTYQVEVRDQAGNMATSHFVIDKTPPNIIGVENGKVYNTDITLKFMDSLSGIKSAVLNGNNILSCAHLTENGEYRLKVMDYGENYIEWTFKIQK